MSIIMINDNSSADCHHGQRSSLVSALFVRSPRADSFENNARRDSRRTQRNLEHAITLMAEEVERLLDVVQREPVRHERPQVDLPVRHEGHQPPHAFLPARTQRRDYLLIAETGMERLV